MPFDYAEYQVLLSRAARAVLRAQGAAGQLGLPTHEDACCGIAVHLVELLEQVNAQLDSGPRRYQRRSRSAIAC